jgi:hypothetical protein
MTPIKPSPLTGQAPDGNFKRPKTTNSEIIVSSLRSSSAPGETGSRSKVED